MANCYYERDTDPEVRQEELTHVALCTWSFVRAMKRHLSPEEEDEFAFQLELREKLPRKQAEMIISAAHRPNRALQDLTFAIEQLPMHFVRKNEIHQAVTIFEDNLGSSERLLTSPVPLFYSRHTARYITVWLFLMPLGLYDEFRGSWNHVAMIPAIFFIALFMFGIEELATQRKYLLFSSFLPPPPFATFFVPFLTLHIPSTSSSAVEEPFTILPMQAFCDKIYNWCNEIMSWSPGDNGRQLKPIKPEHKSFHNPSRN
jgi:putative membrane protein